MSTAGPDPESRRLGYRETMVPRCLKKRSGAITTPGKFVMTTEKGCSPIHREPSTLRKRWTAAGISAADVLPNPKINP